jgi:hypothetical protein
MSKFKEGDLVLLTNDAIYYDHWAYGQLRPRYGRRGQVAQVVRYGEHLSPRYRIKLIAPREGQFSGTFPMGSDRMKKL